MIPSDSQQIHGSILNRWHTLQWIFAKNAYLLLYHAVKKLQEENETTV